MWNTRKRNLFDGDESKFQLSCAYLWVGWDDAQTYHITIENDITSMNKYSFILKTIFERFILFNSKSEKDKSKFDKKPIITYVCCLKSKTYHKIDWTWDSECQSILLDFLHKQMYKHYQSHHIDIYKYFEFLKTKKDQLFGMKLDAKTPFEYIYRKMKKDKYPNYLISIFEEFDRSWKQKNTNWVKSITDNENIFIDTLNKRLNQDLLDFFKLNEAIDEDY